MSKLPPLTIRPAAIADMPAIKKLERATFTSHAISDRQMHYLQKNPNAVFLVARRNGEVAGNGIALVRRNPNGGHSGRIYSLVVDVNHRGQRIGQKLMVALLRALSNRKINRVYLEVEETNSGAIHLYEQLGFKRLKALKHFYGRGKHGVHMRFEFSNIS